MSKRWKMKQRGEIGHSQPSQRKEIHSDSPLSTPYVLAGVLELIDLAREKELLANEKHKELYDHINTDSVHTQTELTAILQEANRLMKELDAIKEALTPEQSGKLEDAKKRIKGLT